MLPPYPHPPSLKEVPSAHPRFSSVPVHLPPFRPSQGSQADGSLKGSQTSPIPKQLAYQSPISGGGISEHSDCGEPNPVLRVDNQSTQVFSFVGYQYHLDSALVKPNQDRWLKLQDLILRLRSKPVLTARCLMSLIGFLASTEKMVPEGRLHIRPFQWHLKENWRYPQLLDILLPLSVTISAHLEWWQNPVNTMKGADLHPKDHNIQNFTDASNKGCSQTGKKATHKCSGVECGIFGSEKVQGPVSKSDTGCLNVMADSLSRSNQENGHCIHTYLQSQTNMLGA